MLAKFTLISAARAGGRTWCRGGCQLHLAVSFRQACAVVTTGLSLGSFAATAHGREHLIDLFNRKGLGIKIIADPVAHFFVPFVVGIVEGIYKVVESGDASTIFRWTCELTIRADRIRHIRINAHPPFPDNAMLPTIPTNHH